MGNLMLRYAWMDILSIGRLRWRPSKKFLPFQRYQATEKVLCKPDAELRTLGHALGPLLKVMQYPTNDYLKST